MKIQIHKIKQYKFNDLLIIFLYRLLYKCIIIKRHVNVALFFKKYPVIKSNTTKKLDFGTYEHFCYKNVRDISLKADRILSGEVLLFGKWFSLDYRKDWLKDPISGKAWPSGIYANEAAFEASGYGDVKYVLELNKLNMLVDVALAYSITKDIKYINFIGTALSGWKNIVLPERSVANRIVMDIAYRAINLVGVCVLCRDNDLFVKNIQPQILGILKHHESYMWDRLSSRWFKSQNDNNHNVGELVGIIITQMWLSYMIGVSYKTKHKTELRYLNDVLDKIVAQSGGYLEQSGNYAKVVCEFLMAFEILSPILHLEDSKQLRRYSNSRYLQRLSKYLCNISYNDVIDNFGDNDGASVLPAFEKNIYSIKHIIDYTEQNQENRDYSDVSQWIYNSKNTDMLHVFMRAGRFAYYVEGAYIHAHNDLLSVILSAKGSPVFIDKGCLFYNSGISIKEEYTSYKAHNSVTIDGLNLSDIMAVGFKNYPSSKILSENHDKDSCEIKTQLQYRNIIHSRNLHYKDGTVSIEDIIEMEDDSIHNACLSFLLAPQLLTAVVNKNTISLKDTVNDNEFVLNMEGVSNLSAVKDCFYPSYGIKRETNRIVAELKFVKTIKIVSSLTLT